MATTTTGTGYRVGVGTSSAAAWDVSAFNSASSGNIQFSVPQVPQCAAGHTADTNLAEYLDGEIATNCLECGQRITFKALPGGVPLLRLKFLLEQVMGGEFDKSRALEDFAAITEALQTERSVLDAADALLAIARTLLEK